MNYDKWRYDDRDAQDLGRENVDTLERIEKDLAKTKIMVAKILVRLKGDPEEYSTWERLGLEDEWLNI